MYYLLLCDKGIWTRYYAAESRYDVYRKQSEYIQATQNVGRLRTKVASPVDIKNYGYLGWEDNAVVEE